VDDPPDPPPAADDRRLLAAFRRGDRAAFDALFDRYAGRVLAFALQLTGGCRADAEDLVQETFVAAYRAAPGFRGGSRLLTWLLGILVRRHRDGRRRNVVPTVPLLDEHDGLAPVSRHSPVESEVVSGTDFRCALGALDASLREAFLLVAAQGLTHKEAAGVLGVPEGTVKWRVAEATRRLRAALTEMDDDEETEPQSRLPEAAPLR
jgi:RNA polymerase sigma-70 factor (ECF subfamily)